MAPAANSTPSGELKHQEYVRKEKRDRAQLIRKCHLCEHSLPHEAVDWVLTTLQKCWKIPQQMQGARMLSPSTHHVPGSYCCAFGLRASLERDTEVILGSTLMGTCVSGTNLWWKICNTPLIYEKIFFASLMHNLRNRDSPASFHHCPWNHNKNNS